MRTRQTGTTAANPTVGFYTHITDRYVHFNTTVLYRQRRGAMPNAASTRNRNGLTVLGGVSPATGTAERAMALDLLDRHRGQPGGGSRLAPTRLMT